MFFGKNNNSNSVNVNTTFLTSYSDTALVTLSGWNKNLSLKISPCIGKDDNGVNQYAQNNTQQILTSITQENAIALNEGYQNELKPKMEKGESSKISISMGTDGNKKVVSLGYDADAKVSYLEIAVNVQTDGSADSNNVLKHVFNKRSYLVNYQPSNGSGEEVPVEAELFKFVKHIEMSYELTPVTAHATNYNNATKAAYSKNGNGGFNNNGGNQSSNGSYNAPTSNYSGDSMGDFIPFS